MLTKMCQSIISSKAVAYQLGEPSLLHDASTFMTIKAAASGLKKRDVFMRCGIFRVQVGKVTEKVAENKMICHFSLVS